MPHLTASGLLSVYVCLGYCRTLKTQFLSFRVRNQLGFLRCACKEGKDLQKGEVTRIYDRIIKTGLF